MSSFPKSKKETELDRVREQLRYWPYTINHIEDTLDMSLIEGRGRQLLFQAINSRSLTAFVGSGLSASYGRLSWRDWQKTQFDVVTESVDAFLALAEEALALLELHRGLTDPNDTAALPGWQGDLRARYFDDAKSSQKTRFNAWRWFRFRIRQIEDAQQQIAGLNSTFVRTTNDVGSFPGGEALPLKFQIAQQLHDQLRAHIQIFLPPTGLAEHAERTREECWPGARIDQESAAPRKALEELKRFLKDEAAPQMAKPRADFASALDRYIEVFQRPQTSVSSETLSKLLLFDERAHAMISLSKGLVPEFDGDPIEDEQSGNANRALTRELEREFRIYDATLLKREIPGIREIPEVYRVLHPFRFDTLTDLRNRIRASSSARAARWESFLGWEAARQQDYADKVESAGDERKFLTPSSRFMLSVYLCLNGVPDDYLERDDETGALKKDGTILGELTYTDFSSRRSIIANRFDPLAKTVRRLGITRYITTNYDFEIERFFQDAGYHRFPPKDPRTPLILDPPPPPDTDFRSDATGGILMDQSFDRRHASDLAAFSVGDQGGDAAVFHLHGRATKNSPLVITEKDYMDLYLLEDDHCDTVNEAITMAFSSAPIVFLGLGM